VHSYQEQLLRGTQSKSSAYILDSEHLYRTLLIADRYNAEVHRLLGLLLAEKEQFDEAITLLENAIRLDGKDLSNLLALAQVLQASGRREAAFRLLDSVHKSAHKKFNCDAALLLELGKIYAIDQQYELALSYLQAVPSESLSYLEAFDVQGRVLIDMSDWPAVFEHYHLGLAIYPENPDFAANVGHAAVQMGNIELAEQYFCLAVRYKPDNAYALFSMAQIYNLQRRFQEAEVNLMKALMLDGESEMILIELAKSYLLMSNAEKLKQTACRVLEIAPDHLYAHIYFARSYCLENNFSQAEFILREALVKHPTNEAVLNEIGNIVLRMGNDADILNHCALLQERQPNSLNTYYNVANMYQRFNKNDDAIEVLKRGLKLFASNTELAELLARCLGKNARYKEAISCLLKAGKNIRHAKVPQKIYYELGKNYHKDAQYGKAFAAFTTANEIMRNSDQAEQFDPQNFLHELNSLKVNVIPTFSNIWRYGAPTAEQSPIFLLGFPCSGSELLGKVLHAHPLLWTLNNKPSLSAVTQQLKTRYGSLDKALPQVTNEQLGRLRTLYLQTVEQFNDKKLSLRTVDNQPLNSALSGVLYPLFPKAKFIFMLRHPLDACLSAYMRNFSINEKTVCFTDLVTTAQTYARAMDVWMHNVEQFPIDYHILRYEDLLDDPKAQTAELCDYLQLPWCDDLLQPIVQNTKFNWTHYRAAIEPIRGLLMPYIEQFGYDVD